MSVTDLGELTLRLANLLEGALPAMEKEAAAERRREAGKPLRNITSQQRLEAARRAVAEAFEAYERACE